jgi:hypothetical protein
VQAPAVPASCVTVKVCPAIVTVPLREAPLLAAAVTTTVPLPVPEAPDLMVMNEAEVEAVHVHVGADACT